MLLCLRLALSSNLDILSGPRVIMVEPPLTPEAILEMSEDLVPWSAIGGPLTPGAPVTRKRKADPFVAERGSPKRSDRNHRGRGLRLSGSPPRRVAQSLCVLRCTRR